MTTDTIGSSGDPRGGWPGYSFAQQITASASGILQTIGVNITLANGNFRVAIYDDDNNKPGNLLGESASTAAVAGWQDLAIPGGVVIVAATKYWLACQQEPLAIPMRYYFQSGAGLLKRGFYAKTYSAFDATWPISYLSDNANTANWRMTYAGLGLMPIILIVIGSLLIVVSSKIE